MYGKGSTDQRFCKIGKASEILGVSRTVLRRWADTGSIRTIRTPGQQRLFDPSSIQGYLVEQEKEQITRKIVLYARVSSHKQQPDLLRQQLYLRTHLSDKHPGCQQALEVKDVGSGLNFKRPGLLRVLGLVASGLVSSIIVASRDRLARFGFELIEWICSQHACKIIVLDHQDGAPEDELGKDLMSIVQIYCCRWNGRRVKGAAEDEDDEAEAEPNEGAESSVGRVCRLQPIHVQQGSGSASRRGKHPQVNLQNSGQVRDESTEGGREETEPILQESGVAVEVSKKRATKRNQGRLGKRQGMLLESEGGQHQEVLGSISNEEDRA
jgi:excisionase family DNA binding protein